MIEKDYLKQIEQLKKDIEELKKARDKYKNYFELQFLMQHGRGLCSFPIKKDSKEKTGNR